MRRAAAVHIVLDEVTRTRLERTAGSQRGQIRDVLRARIAVQAADGSSNALIARSLATSGNTARKWRGRFVEHSLPGLDDAQRPGRPKIYGPEIRVTLVATATSAHPHAQVQCGDRRSGRLADPVPTPGPARQTPPPARSRRPLPPPGRHPGPRPRRTRPTRPHRRPHRGRRDLRVGRRQQSGGRVAAGPDARAFPCTSRRRPSARPTELFVFCYSSRRGSGGGGAKWLLA